MATLNEARFLPKLGRCDVGCWEWEGSMGVEGYGRYGSGPGSRLAHRVVYEYFVGPIPSGMDLDHLCAVRDCVNPEHLEPVTRSENARRGRCGEPSGKMQRAKTHCKLGHPLDYVAPKTGGRACTVCRAAASKRGGAKRKARRQARRRGGDGS